MCAKHSPAAFKVWRNLVRRTEREPGRGAKPASSEFSGLKLESSRAAVYHCHEHRHAAGRWGFGRGRVAPLLPLFPYMRKVSIIERLHGDVHLTDTGYSSTADDVEGTITVEMTHSDWQEPLRRYRKKHRVPEGGPVGFSAGFVMLIGKIGLAFGADQPVVLDNGSGLWFRGDSADHDLFANVPGRYEGAWNPSITYQLKEGRGPKEIPLWIVPSIVPASDQRTLEIDLHWNPLSKDSGPRLELFDRIQLSIPAEWGNMESADPDNAVTTAPAEGVRFRVIDWIQLRPTGQGQSAQSQQGRTCPLKIRFENPIPPQSKLSGRVEATFDGTLSGVTGAGIYLPGGRRDGLELEVKPKTKVTVNFTVSLDALRYQDDRVIPDENNEQDAQKNRVDEFLGVVPDGGVIVGLTDAISEDDYYVKSVVEHPPYRDDSRADVLNRVWDIAGRSYEGVFPIDFDISVRGEEVQGRSGASAGKTAVQVTVKGAYATGGNADGTLLSKIEQKWDDLHAKVVKAFSDRAIPLDDAWLPGSAAVAVAVEPTIEPAAIERGVDNEPRALEQAEILDSAVIALMPVEVDTDKKADLHRQWKDADAAVMEGRISEGVYRMMIARIVSELRDLGEELGE
jgi:hypothetical protein